MTDGSEEVGLNVENTLWANTVVAAGTATGVVIYTGCETRSVMNNSQPRSKVGLLDMEINGLTKVSSTFIQRFKLRYKNVFIFRSYSVPFWVYLWS